MENLILWLQQHIQERSLLYFILLYAAGGKPVALGAAKLCGLDLRWLGSLAVLMDALQIPCFFYLYHHAFRSERLQWLRKRIESRTHSIKGSRLFGMLHALGYAGVFLITMMPVKGGGIWSGALLAHMMGMPKKASFPLLICSSILSILLIVGLFDVVIHMWHMTAPGR